jgi:hypothetical protein
MMKAPPTRDMCGSLEYGIRNFVFYQPECHSNVMELVALPHKLIVHTRSVLVDYHSRL